MMRRSLFPALLATSILFAQADSKIAATVPRIESGRKLFLEACSACHGQNGGGGHGPSLIDSRQVRDMDDDKMFQSIQNGVKGTAMPSSPLPKQQIEEIVAFVRSLSAPAIDSAAKGDAVAGKALYAGKGGCVKCHAIGGAGGWMGPDLTNAGVAKTLAQLRESILDPDRRIAEGFAGAAVTTKDGARLEGVVKNYDNYSVQLLDKTGKLHRFARTGLAKFELLEHSLMPRDYATRLTAAELEDLLAYLARQSVRARDKQ